MMPGALRACLERAPGLQRWHFQHGPIDLIIGIEGRDEVMALAVEAAWARFITVLEELVKELPVLRTPLSLGDERDGDSGMDPVRVQGPVARRMAAACLPFARDDRLFITPMAAVAGSVAEEIIVHLQLPGIRKAWVNNGGDIAWYAPSEPQGVEFAVSVNPLNEKASLNLRPSDHCWGVATSGWRGRSQSLGIADSVTVLAKGAAEADAAATLVANAVSLHEWWPEHPAIRRLPASQVKDQSDLGEQLVTVAVGALSRFEVARALDRGQAFALRLLGRGAIRGALLFLQGEMRVCGSCTAHFQK